jgi:hypothetical protein
VAGSLFWRLIVAGQATQVGCGEISDELSACFEAPYQRLIARGEAILVFGKGRCEPPQPN